jgi:predicted N-formylglutamate amidohydrolase
MRLLATDEPEAFLIENARGDSPLFFSCDHASNRLPRALGDLGLDADQLRAHVAWDPGALEAARELGRRFDAPVVSSGYSRLAIDCNRPLEVASSIPETTCGVDVPGNREINEVARKSRQNELFWPYHRAIERVLADRDARGLRTVFVAMHSFTPEPLGGRDRPWHIGIMHGRDRVLADLLLETLGREPGLVVGDNEPYRVTPGSDYGIPVYAEAAGRPGALVELRQDLATEPTEFVRLVDALERALEASLLRLGRRR